MAFQFSCPKCGAKLKSGRPAGVLNCICEPLMEPEELEGE